MSLCSLLGFLFWLPVFLILCYLTLPRFLLLWPFAQPFSLTLKLAGSLLPLGHEESAPFFLPCLSFEPFDFPSKCMGSELRLGTQNHSPHVLALKGVAVEAGEPLAGFPSHPLSSQGPSRAPTNRGRLGLELCLGAGQGFRTQLPLAHPEPAAFPGTKLSVIWKQAPLPQMIHQAQ